MGSWWKDVMELLGLNTVRPPESDNGQLRRDQEAAKRLRILNEKAREDARRRITALDLRVDVLSRRMTLHEKKKQH